MNPTGPADNRSIPIGELRKAISEPRFATYLAECAGDEDAAWALYEWNIDATAALLLPLHALEVTLRNRLYDAGARNYGANWLTTTATNLRRSELAHVAGARDYLVRRGAAVTPGALVAELSLGFWVGLLANHYDQTLWRQSLYRAFGSGARRTALHESLDRLRTLRNRVAHHEHLLRRNLTEDVNRIEFVLALLSPAVEQWVRERSTARAVINVRNGVQSHSLPPDNVR